MGNGKGTRSGDAPRTLEVDSPGVLSIVEAAYDIDSPPDTWALEMLRAADRAIGAGIGAFLCLYDQPDSGTPTHTSSGFSIGINDDVMSMAFDQYASAPPDWLSGNLGRSGGSARCLLTSELESAGPIDPRGEYSVHSVYDGVNIAATDVTDRGFLMCLAVPANSDLSFTARRILARVASHIVGAMRLRARLGISNPSQANSSSSEALNVEHQAPVPASWRPLAAALGNIEHVSASIREIPKRLASPRWTLVEQLELEGERYVLARENRSRPPRRGPSSLTEAERSVVTAAAQGHTTKEIAYTLCIAETTVRVLLMRAARRCGVQNRRELLNLWSQNHAGGT
jgi:DNA-binding NarL/FixJ family response regulator